MSTVVTTTLASDHVTPVQAYAALRAASPGRSSFLLESVVPGERWGRFSIVGCRAKTEGIYPGDPFAMLDEDVGKLPAAERLAAMVSRAFVGHIAYDTVHTLHKIEPWQNEGTHGRFMRDSTVLVFDNLEQTLTIAGTNDNVLKRVREIIEKPAALKPLPAPDPAALPEHLDVSMSDEAYAAKVQRAKEYIAAGDVFQVVLARRFTSPLRGADPFDVYRAMRMLSPSPYLYFLEFAESPQAEALTIAGCSPETMVRIDGDRMTLRPIAGTRPRGATEAEDQALAAELLADPKERAEHVMLVDLARNDLGRVCEAGSVEVTRNMEVERYSHVMHLVSEVSGRPRDAHGAGELARAAFPAGTLTGAPKVRATQIIRELEKEPRDVYGGAIGWFGGRRNVDLAIAIRTVVARRGMLEVNAGAGIVLDSVPEKEAEETRNKARAPLAAIRAAQDQADAAPKE